MMSVLGAGFVKGWLVPGWMYVAAVKRAERAEAVAVKALASVDAVTATVKQSLDDRSRPAGG